MMTLKAYLEETGEKQVLFADRVGTTPATISRLCGGTLKPSLDLAHSIETATAGKVPTETWVVDPTPADASQEAA
jgi:DNA-binding XRE family transcriptional regulator